MKIAALALAGLCGAWAGEEPGLLFHLSGDRDLAADHAAGGDPAPNFASEQIRTRPGGAKGGYIECGERALYSYWAPGNIYAQRGTLAFYWRSRTPAGKTEFPVFRVGYGDHSSWDMVWLRIDYNGKPGFDAFVTDVNLGRTRVSHAMAEFPKPDEWVHLALAWDEGVGIRFYVNGRRVAEVRSTGLFDAALDQFGPHARAINAMQVHSTYNFSRGGDLDEVRIYDRMMSDANIAALARGENPGAIPELVPDPRMFSYRYGWNRAGDLPPALTGRYTAVRKVEIHEVYDLKRWWWKANDGIRETTWPGVYNRSRLAGRNDYFQLPDWDCYSESGKNVTFTLPAERWNHVEIAGAAWGVMTQGARTLFQRGKGDERTFHRVDLTPTGGGIRFSNAEQETPIGELGVYDVREGREPAGIGQLRYRLTARVAADNPALDPLVRHIAGRYPPAERATVVALPAGAPSTPRTAVAAGLPVVHVLIPAGFRDMPVNRDHGGYSYTWDNIAGGLDGIAIDLPALAGNGLMPMNVRVLDPLWPARTMFDFSFSVKPGEPHTLWLDMRDRILPNGKSLYLTIAAGNREFGASSLEGAEVRLIFKPWREAAREHEVDRFTQARDNYAHIVEERPNTHRLRLFTRLESDLTDLLRVNPDHTPGRNYWYELNREQPRPAFTQPVPPAGVPLWAFRQVEDLRVLKRFVHYYIDQRQIENGEFGGGLSDDGDLTNWWPGAALMGVTPEKIRRSLVRLLDAFYEQGLFLNGLSTIMTDELHSYEEGIQALSQAMMLDYGSPKQMERAMETARRLEWLTGVNAAGHRHIRSSYFNGERMSEEGVWAWSRPSSYLITHPTLELVEYNGSPALRKIIVELGDGLLAHRKAGRDGRLSFHASINFSTDEDQDSGLDRAWHILWAAWRWTGDRKYLQPFLDDGPASLRTLTANALDVLAVRETWGKQVLGSSAADANSMHIAWQVSGDRSYLERLYANQIEAGTWREYLNTEGSMWIDRVMVDTAELQRARLGGVALVRNALFPGHAVSWRFEAPADGDSVAVLVPESTPERIRIAAYNLETAPVKAVLTGWDVEPGEWELTVGGASRKVEFGRTHEIELTLAPRAETGIGLKLLRKGVPYWSRPDLGISNEDVRVEAAGLRVRVHSLGGVDAPASRVVVRDTGGRVLAEAPVPALKAPLDLMPKTAEVMVALAGGKAGSVTVEAGGEVPEITLMNNRVELK